MSLYSKKAKIDGLTFGLVMRGAVNGQYIIVIERDCATLDQIEAVNWTAPTIEGDCILPAGYGFEVEDIAYSSSDKSYRVTVQVAKQFLGDVTGYVAQVEELEEKLSAGKEQISGLRDQLAEADEALITLYERQATPSESVGKEEQAQ